MTVAPRLVVLTIAAACLLGCTKEPEGPKCSSSDAQSTLISLLWDQVQESVAAQAPTVAAQIVKMAQAQISLHLDDVATTSAEKDVKRVSCQASIKSALPESLKIDRDRLGVVVANAPGDVHLNGQELSGSVEYSVLESDDGKSIRVQANGFKTYTDVLAAVGAIIYTTAENAKAVQSQIQTPSETASSARSAESPTNSGDGTLPTFEKGESYTTVRQKLMSAGWQPFHSPDADSCSDGDARCKGRPEMEACAGTGMANCKFLWKKGGKTLAIDTVGEDAEFDNVEQ